eukprot:SAG31_NODE_13700_length_852_cov_1.439575_1_plen_117_part_00
MQASTINQNAKQEAALRQLLADQESTITKLMHDRERALGDAQMNAAEADVLRGNWSSTSLHKLSMERLLSVRDTLMGRQADVETVIAEAEERVHRLLSKAPAAELTRHLSAGNPQK